MDVLGLLQSKNRCLKKFLELSAEFLKSAEKGDLSALSDFESRRDAIVRVLELFDRRIAEAIQRLPAAERSDMLIAAIHRELEAKNTLVQSILSVDEKIMMSIEREKDRIAQDIASSEKGKNMVKKFKSSWVPESGEEFDAKL